MRRSRFDVAAWLIGGDEWGYPRSARFGAYARLLHPLGTDYFNSDGVSEQVRWRHLAEWSAIPLTPVTAFWQLALPDALPTSAVPGRGAPASPSLGVLDSIALARHLRAHTTTPDDCWFAVWDGYPKIEGVSAASSRITAFEDEGSRLRLPHRSYQLVSGPVDFGVTLLRQLREPAHLWWPRDRSWLVYGDVDLNYSYVGGSEGLAAGLVASSDLEAQRATENALMAVSTTVPKWLNSRIRSAVESLIVGSSAELDVVRFSLKLDLEGSNAPPLSGKGRVTGLRYVSAGTLGTARRGWVSVGRTADLSAQLAQHVKTIVIAILDS